MEHPVVKLEVMIDGRQAYKCVFSCDTGSRLSDIAYRLDIVGKPVELKTSASLAAVIPSGILGVLDRIGLKPSDWFSF
jgi:alkaline phosphatase D